MHSVTLKVEGMHCDGCAATMQALLAMHRRDRKAMELRQACLRRIRP